MTQDRKRNQKRVEAIKSATPFSTDVANIVDSYGGYDLSLYYDKIYSYSRDKDRKLLAEAEKIDSTAQTRTDPKTLTSADKLAILAVHSNCVDTVCYLLEQELTDPQKVLRYRESDIPGLPLGAKTKMEDNTLLSLAIQIRRLNIADLILDNYPVKETINLSLDSLNSFTLLGIAIEFNFSLQFIKKLLDKGASATEVIIPEEYYLDDQKKKWITLNTPIFLAIRNQRPEIVQLLLAYNRNTVIFKDDQYKSPVYDALQRCWLAQKNKKQLSTSFLIMRLVLRVAALIDGSDDIVSQAASQNELDINGGWKQTLRMLEDKNVEKLFNQYFAFTKKRHEFQRFWSEEKGTEFEKTISCLKKISGTSTSQLYTSSPALDIIKHLEQNAHQFKNDPEALLEYLQNVARPAPKHILTAMLFFLEAKLTECILDRMHKPEYNPAAGVKLGR